jgi:hypothetical protein
MPSIRLRIREYVIIVHHSFCRPIAGYFNLCPKQISSLPHDTYQMLSTIKHEILHALVSEVNLLLWHQGDR